MAVAGKAYGTDRDREAAVLLSQHDSTDISTSDPVDQLVSRLSALDGTLQQKGI